MCGIIGILSEKKADMEKFHRALKSMQHRGPDDSGVYSDNFITLGHNRLSIIDLSKHGRQPMSDSEGNIWITFNGEIYNYLELREYLGKLGYNFKSNTDTEVIIYLYKYYGIDFVHKLRGMFAIGIWDRANKKLILCRDRFGKKPLYYSFYKNSFVFASEIKAIRFFIDKALGINKDALLQYLSFLASLPPNTMFENIHKLQSGHMLIFKGGNITISEYYDPIKNLPPLLNDKDEVLESIEEHLKRSVHYRLVSDVEVGSYLSGGIDSSMVSALYSNLTTKPINTFSVGYTEHKQYDELYFAKRVADHIHANYHETIMSRDDFINSIDSVVHYLEEPINDPACVPTYILSRLVNEHGIKVCLSGEGSDEIFFGYDKYHDFLKYYDLQQSLNASQKTFILNYLLLNFSISKEWEYFNRTVTDEPVFRTIGENFTDSQKKLLLNRDVFKDVTVDSSLNYIDGYKTAFEDSELKHPSYWFSYIDLKIWMPEVIMMKLDKMSMANSVELRAPCLDHELVELLFRVDPEIRVGKENKNLLKSIACKYLPEDIVYRRKKGFSYPFIEWLNEHFRNELLKDIKDLNRETGFFNDKFIEFLLNEGSEKGLKQHIWSLLILSRWYKLNFN
ncbi:MAG: asparagine synthase (glutamine-hydrolyzing) [Nitrospirota bacterium]